MNKINYTQIARQLKVLAEPKRLKINLCDKARHIEPHRKVSQHGGSRDDDDV